MSAAAILFANATSNIGEVANLEAMLRVVAARFPGRRIDVHGHSFLQADEVRLMAFRAADATLALNDPDDYFSWMSQCIIKKTNSQALTRIENATVEIWPAGPKGFLHWLPKDRDNLSAIRPLEDWISCGRLFPCK